MTEQRHKERTETQRERQNKKKTENVEQRDPDPDPDPEKGGREQGSHTSTPSATNTQAADLTALLPTR